MTSWHMRIACGITKAINTISAYVIIVAFPLQKWLHERASTLRYTYVACSVATMKNRSNKLLKYSTVSLFKILHAAYVYNFHTALNIACRQTPHGLLNEVHTITSGFFYINTQSYNIFLKRFYLCKLLLKYVNINEE